MYTHSISDGSVGCEVGYLTDFTLTFILLGWAFDFVHGLQNLYSLNQKEIKHMR
jgi:hypothetical protein